MIKYGAGVGEPHTQIVVDPGVVPANEPGHLREMAKAKFHAGGGHDMEVLQAPGNKALFMA